MPIPLSQFIALYPSKNTADNYHRAVRKFLDAVIPNPCRSPEEYDPLSLEYCTAADRDRAADLRTFAASLSSYAPLSAQLYMAGVYVWLEANDIDIPRSTRRRVAGHLPKGGAQTIDGDLDHDSLRKILSHMDIKGRALTLLMASSGMRIGEALQLPLDVVDLSTRPAEIHIPGRITKGGSSRLSFISQEAAQAIEEWLKVRGAYITSALDRNAGLRAVGRAGKKPPSDPRLFPFSVTVARGMWETAVTAAGLNQRDPSTGRLTMTYHGLRKFYLSQAKLVIPAEIPEALSGHRGYLTDAYRRYTRAQLAEYYQKAEPQLTIMAPQELREITGEFRQKMQVHSEILENLVSENIGLKKRLESIEKVQAEMDAISALVAKYQK